MPSQRAILRFWLPLAAMWLLMALEQPLLSAVIARLAEPKLNLAAYGLTFSLALIVESPVIMFLTMGTALAKGRQSYRRLLHFTHIMAWGLIALHLLVGLTPLYSFIVGRLVAAPPETVEPSRIAFLLMAPWSGAIAYRRFWQGVLIRYGRSNAVAATTAIRLLATAAVAGAGLATAEIAGANVAGAAVSAGVIVSAVVAWWLSRSTVRRHCSDDRLEMAPLTWPSLLQFYLPLAMTSFINLAGQPVLSLGLSRAPLPLESLALWPVVNGLLFLMRSGGVALQEVIVALMQDERAYPALRRFSTGLALVLSLALAVIAISPLADIWFRRVAGLAPELASMARLPAILLILVPALTALTSWRRGVLVHRRRTTPITVATALNIGVLVLAMLGAPQLLNLPGAVIASLALTLSLAVEVAYLSWQARTMAPSLS